jgi:ADP-ribose pyrophosphatase
MIRRRRRRYTALRKQWPKLFNNPPEAPYEILFKRSEIKAAEASEKDRLSSKGLPRSWRFTGVVFESPWLIVVRDAVRFPSEKREEKEKLGTYIRTMPPSGFAGSAILPVLAGKDIVLLRHFRHATRQTHLEIPRGYGDVGLSTAEQAVKELYEEIKAKTREPISLGMLHTNTGGAADCVELFLAEIQEFGKPQTSEGILAIEVYNPIKVAELIHHGEITDSFTIAAFTRAWLANLLPGLPCTIDIS